MRIKPLVTSHNHYEQPSSKEKVDNNEQITSIQAKTIGKNVFLATKTKENNSKLNT